MEEKIFKSIHKDNVSFKIIDADETERTGELVLIPVSGMTLKGNEEKKRLDEAIENFNTKYREGKKAIKSFLSSATEQLKHNVEKLKNPKADERKLKRAIKIIKDSEDDI